jgi:cytochrome oxidase Cu insertion factor (SCO1/SenC/PrrC family)/thiol-disulfide isomerase/thioredoxin
LRLRAVRWIAWPLVGACTLALVAARVLPRLHAAPTPQVDAAGDPIDAGTALGGVPAPGFTLTDQFGRSHALADFRGKPVVLAFIDSRCTTTCPLTAQMLVDAKRQLGPAGARVQLLAVNANPTATSVADVLAWSQAHAMTDQWLFLTGPAAELNRLYDAYHVAVETDPDGEVTHTDAVYVLDAQGRERYLFTTDPNFSGTVPESTNLARRIAAVMPGRVAVHPMAVAAGAATTAFSLPALLPGGATGQVAAGSPAVGGPRLVAFFATWCTACREDLQTLAQYAAQASGKGLPPVVAVDLRVAEPSTQWVASFLQKAGVPFPVGLDDSGRVLDAYKVTDLPFTAVVAPDGRILWQHTGVLSLEQLTSEVAAAVGGR